jgi:hypothetical protein
MAQEPEPDSVNQSLKITRTTILNRCTFNKKRTVYRKAMFFQHALGTVLLIKKRTVYRKAMFFSILWTCTPSVRCAVMSPINCLVIVTTHVNIQKCINLVQTVQVIALQSAIYLARKHTTSHFLAIEISFLKIGCSTAMLEKIFFHCRISFKKKKKKKRGLTIHYKKIITAACLV